MTGESISLGDRDPRGRRDLQEEQRLEFPLRKTRDGRTGVQVDPKSAVGVDPARGLGVRVQENGGLGIGSASPFALKFEGGPEFDIVAGKVRTRLANIIVNPDNKLEARPTAAQVSETTDGDTQSAIDRLGAAIAAIEADFPIAAADVTFTPVGTIAATNVQDAIAEVAAEAGGGAVATDAIWDAKGDLAGGTGANTAAALTVGANGTVLTADSAETTGMKWAAPGGVADGDKGDIVVSGSGAVWTLDSGVVTAAAKTVLDDASVSAMVDTLGGAAAVGTGGLARAVHASRHQNGGADELSVTGLSGLLADPQTPDAHTHGAGDITSVLGTDFGGTGLDLSGELGDYALVGSLGVVSVASATTGYVLTGQGIGAAPAFQAIPQAWPIGSVFTGVVSTNPNTLLGYGTWSAFGAGKVLVGRDSGDGDFDTAEETGGAKTVASTGSNAAEAAHTHTYTQVPNHVHVQSVGTAATGGLAGYTYDASTNTSVASGYSTANPTGGVATGTTAAGSSHNHTFTGTASSVVQPYIVVYFWKRTA